MVPVDARSIAKRYLTPPVDGFWRWSEQGDAIVWKDGDTIVFQAELAEILKPLAPTGLPRMGSVLLLLAATRDSWRSEPVAHTLTKRQLLRRIWNSTLSGPLPAPDEEAEHKELILVLAQLARIAKLDEDVRKSVGAKQTIIETAFENRFQTIISKESAAEILRLLGSDTNEIFVDSRGNADSGSKSLREDVSQLLGNINHVANAEALRSRRAISLEQPIEPVDTDSLDELSRDQLIGLLSEDGELYAVGRSAKQFVAAFSLPRKISSPDEIPMGGFSDIANRGTLDRLLLSELANDDMTLAVRVALNEAMYLRRETPPEPQSQTRTIVVDCGIRMWGIPRVYATGLALALGAREREATTTVKTCYAKGNELVEFDLNSRQSVFDFQTVLRHEMHIGECLLAVAQDLKEGSSNECALIVSAESLLDSKFVESLKGLLGYVVHIVSVDRSGECELLQWSGAGIKTLKTIHLNFDEINQQPRSVNRPSQTMGDKDLPIAFSMEQFPLRFANYNKKHVWCAQDGVAFSLLPVDGIRSWRSVNRSQSKTHFNRVGCQQAD